jgi:hypothetical protein
MFLIFRSCPSLVPEHRFMLTYEGSISEQATRKKKKKNISEQAGHFCTL